LVKVFALSALFVATAERFSFYSSEFPSGFNVLIPCSRHERLIGGTNDTDIEVLKPCV